MKTMLKRLIYYFTLCFGVLLYSQDVPLEFEYEQSTSQAFYLFENFQILENDLEANDWIGVFNIYDETLNGECETEEQGFDETNGGICYVNEDNMFACIPGLECEDSDCSDILDVDGDGFLSECACPDIDGDNLIATQNIEVAVGARRYGDCLDNNSRESCDVPASGYNGDCYTSGYLT
jgi:hypothetical protein